MTARLASPILSKVLDVDRLERVLCSDAGPQVLHTLTRLVMGQAPEQDGGSSALQILQELGLGQQTQTHFELGEFGHKCADAAREYEFWTARHRTLHREGTSPALVLSNFAGKRVLEVGPGWGCNLFRLQQVTPHARGREIEAVYVRMSSIFAKIEGVEPPTIDIGGGEQLPYADNSFDWVVMFSALQYMDVRAAMREVARVLAPGGRFLSTQPTLAVLLKDMARSAHQPRVFAHRSMALLNSAAYALFGRRLRESDAAKATSRPVFLTPAQLVSMAQAAGLRFLPEQSGNQPRDFLLVAQK